MTTKFSTRKDGAAPMATPIKPGLTHEGGGGGVVALVSDINKFPVFDLARAKWKYIVEINDFQNNNIWHLVNTVPYSLFGVA